MHVHRDHTAGPDTAYHARRSDALYQVPKWQGKMWKQAPGTREILLAEDKETRLELQTSS